MKRCKKCNGIISISLNDVDKGYTIKDLKRTTPFTSSHNLCKECFEKVLNDE